MPKKQVEIDITLQTYGIENIDKLNSKLNQLKANQMSQAEVQRLVSKQAQVAIQQSRHQLQVNQARVKLSDSEIRTQALLNNLNEDAQYEIDNRMEVEQRAHRLRRLYAQDGIKITQEEARVAVQANMQIIESERQKEIAVRNARKAMMQASISLFVMNISANQLVASLKPLVKGNEAAEQAINDMSAILNLALGPMQAFMAMQQLMANLNITLAQTFKMMGSAMLAAFLIMGAMRAESAGMRAVMSALAGVVAVYAAAQFASAMATFLNASAQATLKAVMGNPTALIALGAGIAAGVYAVSTFAAQRPSAQTQPGQRKRINRTGMAEVHEGEVISRPVQTGIGVMGGMTVVVQLPDTYQGTMGQSRMFAKMIERELRAGRSTSNYNVVVG